MKLSERTNSVIDETSSLETLHTLKDFPVFMGCTDRPAHEDLVADQTWDVCRSTGVLQLKHLIPLDVLYQAQHAGAVGQIWMTHHQAFAEFLFRFKPKSVLELGEHMEFYRQNICLLTSFPGQYWNQTQRPLKGAMRAS